MTQQNFPIRNPLLKYIFENASPNVMSKLFRTCKYFYRRKPYCIVEKLKFVRENYIKIKTKTEIIYVSFDQLNSFDNFWVTKLMDFQCCFPEKLLKRISRCNGELFVSPRCDQNYYYHKNEFRLSDYKVFLEYVKLKSWNSFYSSVIGENGELVSLQELLASLPNVTRLRFGF